MSQPHFSKIGVVLVVLSLLTYAHAAEINESSMRQMRELYNQAEQHLEAERFEQARDNYQQLLKLGQELGIDQRTFMELSYRLAKTLAYLKDYPQAHQVLGELIEIHPPDDLALKIEQLQARVYAEQGNFQGAFASLKGLHERIPTVEWGADDRGFFVDVIKRLNQKWEEVLVTAERLFDAGLYEESVPFYHDVVRAVHEGIYPDAIAGKTPSKEIVGKIRYRMAQAYFLDGKYEGVATVLDGITPRAYEGSPELRDVYVNSLYLLGTSARRRGDYEQAIQSFSAYLAQGDRARLPHYEDVHYELGLSYYEAGQFLKARRHFDELAREAREDQLSHLAKLYLARIDFKEGNYRDIEPTLASFVGRLAPEDPLQFEVAYLRGESAYQLGHYNQAAQQFQRAIPNRNRDQAPWYETALLNLGRSYLKQGDDPQKDRTQVMEVYAKAEAAFRELLEVDPKEERARLALARLYMAQQNYLTDESAYGRLDEVLGDIDSFQNRNYQAEALAIKAEALTGRADLKGRQLAAKLVEHHQRLAQEHEVQLAYELQKDREEAALEQQAREAFREQGEQAAREAALLDEEGRRLATRGDAAATYAEREQIFRQLTSDPFQDTDFYAQGWYLRGLNHFSEAQALQASYQRAEAAARYQDAINCLYQAFDLLKERDRAMAGLALKYQAEAYFHLGTYEGRFMAFSLLDRLLQQETSVFQAMKQPDEVYYLKGLMASHLMNDGEPEEFAVIAENSLREVLKGWPTGKFSADSLNVLGTVLFQQGRYREAEQMFVKLANEYPFSRHVGEAWFWAAESAERENQDHNLVRRYRRRVFDEFPESEHAPEAYFKYYTYSEYLQGSEQAINHLVDFRVKYPNTPYLVVANYLLGLDHRTERLAVEDYIPRLPDLNASVAALEESRQHFDFCHEHGLIRADQLDYLVNVRYRSMMEKARTQWEVAQRSVGAKRELYLDYAEQAYREIVGDFTNPDESLVVFLGEPDERGAAQDEAEYGLAAVYAAAEKQELAEEVLQELVHRHQQEGEETGYYVAKARSLQAQLAMKEGDYRRALACFGKAEQAARDGKLMTDEELMTNYLQQSACHKAMGQLDAAMTLLTRVVNQESPSALRTRAMFERAEIYELQGKHDMAVKQLRATAQKGGEWAYKARDKLDSTYGFN